MEYAIHLRGGRKHDVTRIQVVGMKSEKDETKEGMCCKMALTRVLPSSGVQWGKTFPDGRKYIQHKDMFLAVNTYRYICTASVWHRMTR